MQVSVKHLELLRPKTRPIASLIDDVAAGETVNVSASSTTTNHTAVSESESQLHMPTEPAVTLGTLDAEGHLLVSTGYWQIGHSKRGDREQGRHVYERCMPPVMSLNAPMALYGDAAGLEAMRDARQNSGGPLSAAASKEVDVQQLGPCGEAPEALASRGGKAGVTNDGDVPSQELGCIWDGKPRLDLLSLCCRHSVCRAGSSCRAAGSELLSNCSRMLVHGTTGLCLPQ